MKKSWTEFFTNSIEERINEMNELILMTILLATVAYIAKPYWQRQSAMRLPKSNGQLADLKAKRDTLLAAIKDIEFDYQTGKISSEDFSEMNTQYRLQAIETMKRIDGFGNNRHKSQKLEDELNKMHSQQKQPGTNFCPQCGTVTTDSDRFCSECGKYLQ